MIRSAVRIALCRNLVDHQRIALRFEVQLDHKANERI
jgi:hypothetical protein